MKRGRDPESVADFTDTLDPFQHQEIHDVGELKKEAMTIKNEEKEEALKKVGKEAEGLRVVYGWMVEDYRGLFKKNKDTELLKKEKEEALKKVGKEAEGLRVVYGWMVEDYRSLFKKNKDTELLLKKEKEGLQTMETELKKERKLVKKLKKALCHAYKEKQ
jgi:hypothetical protein